METTQNSVPAPPVAAPVDKVELEPKLKEQLTVTLADVNVSTDVSKKRPGERQPIGGASTPSDEGELSIASTRSSSFPLSFRISKNKRKERIGLSLHSGSPGCEGVVISGLQDGAIRGVDARLGDRVVTIGGSPVKDAYEAAEMLKAAVGEVEVVIERIQEDKSMVA